MNKLLLKLWVDSKIEHLRFISDTGLESNTQSVRDQIKLLDELNELFKLEDTELKDLQFH